MQDDKLIQCRMSPTIGALEDTSYHIWGTCDYLNNTIDTVFFGLYGLPDFLILWRHKGKKWILWAGTDIQHFLAGYWLDEKGEMRISAHQLAPWIDTYCESYVENDVEKAALASVGIRSKVVPSFLGDVNSFPVSFAQWGRPKLYTSVSGDNFKLYGWDKIKQLSIDNPDVEFHLYGAEVKKIYEFFRVTDYKADYINLTKENDDNVILHGAVPKEQMNEEIKYMQGALRLTEFDGFSEILAKSVLMGQWPVSLIEYPHMLKLSEIGKLHEKTQPNIEGAEYYRRVLNKYPWNKHA